MISAEITRTKAKTRMGVLGGTLEHEGSKRARLTAKGIAQDVYFHDSCPATRGTKPCNQQSSRFALQRVKEATAVLLSLMWAACSSSFGGCVRLIDCIKVCST